MAKNCIGLDIGSSAVKVVQVKQTKRGVQLVNFGIEPVPPQSIVDGTIMNSSAVADAIRSLFDQLRVRQKDVAIAIAGHSVIKQIPEKPWPQPTDKIPLGCGTQLRREAIASVFMLPGQPTERQSTTPYYESVPNPTPN